MPETWYKVDNVAKVFLASINRRDPRVFRVSCTLNEDVDPDRLNQALEQTARENPQFQVTLHRGLFWHYFESTNLKPQAVPETLAPCAMLYGPQIKNELLYRVSYYGARINVEMFHAISDGNGGMVFLKTLVHNYLQLKNPELANVPGEERASKGESAQDAFRKYYTASKAAEEDPLNRKKSFHLHGRKLPYDESQFFEAHLSTAQVLAKTRAMGVTMTSYLAAAQMLAAYQEMPALERGKVISVSLPVNLRSYYGTETARNFFNSIRISWVFRGDETLETLAKGFDAKLREALKDERVKARMDGFEKLEQMLGIKLVPLFIKNAVVNLFNTLEAKKVTLTISNMGRIPLQKELQPYIKGFTAFCSSTTAFTTVCSYGDDLVLGTTWAFRSTEMLKNFYRRLSAEGLDIHCMQRRWMENENLSPLPYPGWRQRTVLPAVPEPPCRHAGTGPLPQGGAACAAGIAVLPHRCLCAAGGGGHLRRGGLHHDRRQAYALEPAGADRRGGGAAAAARTAAPGPQRPEAAVPDFDRHFADRDLCGLLRRVERHCH